MAKVIVRPHTDHIDSKMRELFKHLGVAHSWELLQILALASSTVGRISEQLGLAESEVSRSLKNLRDLGLVDFVTIKKLHFYALSPRVRLAVKKGMIVLDVPWKGKTSLEIQLDRPPCSLNGR